MIPKYPITQDDAKRIETTFTYHSPKADQPERYEAIRSKAALLILGSCPASRERSLALTHLEDACFSANASIARNE